MFISDEFFFGLHFMVDGYGAPTDVLRDEKRFLEALQAVPLALGMHTISAPLVLEVGPNNAKDPGGLSGFVLIAESHISFHTFPDNGAVLRMQTLFEWI